MASAPGLARALAAVSESAPVSVQGPRPRFRAGRSKSAADDFESRIRNGLERHRFGEWNRESEAAFSRCSNRLFSFS